MGLLSDDGNTEMAALSSLSRAFAGLMFDDLCDSCQDYSSVQTELQRLFDAADHAEPRQSFLLVCLQYDRLFQVLPDPIWWISGTLSLAGNFAVLYTCPQKRRKDKEKKCHSNILSVHYEDLLLK